MSSDPSSRPGQRIDREYLHRRREAEIAAHLESARRALDGEYDGDEAQRALDAAMILDPDNSLALALWDRLEFARANGEESGEVDRDRSTDLPTRWPIAVGIAIAMLLVSAIVLWQTGPGRAGERLLASAQAATDEGRYEEAVALFSQALLLDREDTRAAAGLATSTRALEADRQRAVDAVSARARGRLDAQRPPSDSRIESASGSTAPTSPLGLARIAGVELTLSDLAGRAADPPGTFEPRPVPSPRATPVSLPARTPPVPGPAIDVSLCGDETACGVLTVRVQPTADILLNGVAVGAAAEGVLRLPTGRHQVHLESEAYQFRRVVSIEAGAPVNLDINLEDDGLPSATQTTASDDDLDLGVGFVMDGDFEAAVEVLDAVAIILDDRPEDQERLARAYLYLGYAFLYAYGDAAATQRLYDARMRDPRVVPSPAEFPRRVIRLWETATDPNSWPQPESVVAPDVDNLTISGAPVDPSVWISNTADRLQLQVALAGPDGRCLGEVAVDPTRALLSWSPIDTDGPCSVAMAVPFDEVESVSVAEEGGFAVRVGSEDARRLVFIPQPYNAWFDDGSEGRRQLDLPRVARVASRLAVRGVLTALGRPPSGAWSFYGTPVDIAAPELLNTPAGYDGRAVRTRGQFTNVTASNPPRYTLVVRDAVIGLSPMPESRALVDANASALEGTEINVTGVFRRQPASSDESGDQAPSYAISFWDVSSAVLAETSRTAQALATLLAATPVPMNRPVEVVGQFRGSNLFGDLPSATRSRAGANDWVLREGAASIWVIGARPEGRGWSLNRWSKRDTSTWLRVRGQLEEQEGHYYLRASAVAPAPQPASHVAVSASTLGWQPVPPEVQFVLPLDFEDARPDSQFVIQFTKPMDRRTFEGNVLLRYVGDDIRRGSGFTTVGFSYSEEQRSLHIDPGIALQNGRTLQILLRPGISDLTGIPLDASTALTWRVSER